MRAFRVPFPADPPSRQAMLDRLRELVGRFGVMEGTAEAGSFQGSTPIGRFAGDYHCPAGSDEITITLHEKPLFVSIDRIESEARRLLANA